MPPIAPFIRIALRYLSAALVTAGYLMPDQRDLFADPELVSAVAMFVGGLVGALTEIAYWLAKRLGWAT